MRFQWESSNFLKNVHVVLRIPTKERLCSLEYLVNKYEMAAYDTFCRLWR